MLSFKNISIRKKILLSMLAFTLIPVILVAGIATMVSYRTMRDQLIYDHRMSSGWLQDRLSLEINDMMDQFYEFEVDKKVKADILRWCTQDEELDYAAQWRIITLMNTIISMDSNINSIELFNLSSDRFIAARRSGAGMEDVGDRLNQWEMRDDVLQSNLVFIREEKEILAMHQIHRFDDKTPIALVVFHIRPYHLQGILDEIKTVPEESIIVFNDQNQVIEADYGSNWSMEDTQVEHIRAQLASGERKEASYSEQFWFFRTVNGGKMQILLTIPNKTIVDALISTVTSSIIAAVVAVIASVICSVVYSRAVSRPIIELAQEMKNTTLSDYSGSTQTSREDEIGVLQESFGYMVSRNKELIAQQYQAKLEKRNAQLRALQAQINPHFMYNTLQVIGGMALQKDAPEIYSVTLALSDIMRYSLNFSKEMVPLREELQYLESYVMIQNERFGGRIKLNKMLSKESLDCLIPKLILQPLVENSFEHGLLNKSGEWVINLQSRICEDGDLLIAVSDNGVGFEPKRLKEITEKIQLDVSNLLNSGSHIGLANVNARIRLKGATEAQGLTIESHPDKGTVVSVRMQALRQEGDRA